MLSPCFPFWFCCKKRSMHVCVTMHGTFYEAKRKCNACTILRSNAKKQRVSHFTRQNGLEPKLRSSRHRPWTRPSTSLGSEFSAQTLDTTVDLGSEFRRVCAQRMAERRARLPAKGSARCPCFVEPKWIRIGTLLHVRAVRQSRKPAR